MRLTIVLIIVLLALVGVLVRHQGSQLLDRLRPAAFTAVKVSTIELYGGMRYRGCAPVSRPAAAFPATQARIYDLITFSKWNGQHSATVEYDAPDGGTYASTAFSGQNLANACGFLSLYGEQAAAMPGVWHLHVSADGHSLQSTSFSIQPVGPDAHLLVPASLCAHGCSAALRNPDGSRVSERFRSYSAALTYLRRHPGSFIDLITSGA